MENLTKLGYTQGQSPPSSAADGDQEDSPSLAGSLGPKAQLALQTLTTVGHQFPFPDFPCPLGTKRLFSVGEEENLILCILMILIFSSVSVPVT